MFLKIFKERLEKRADEVQNWLSTARTESFGPSTKLRTGTAQGKLREVRLPIYSSVDLRNAGFKISAIDTNLFPAGFNNLCEKDRKTAAELFRKFFAENLDTPPKTILIIPQDNTRNLYYFSNLNALKTIIENVGFSVILGNIIEGEEHHDLHFKTAENDTITIKKIDTKNGIISVDKKTPDFILLNHDLWNGLPKILHNIKQPILPSPLLGWNHRKKITHHTFYQKLIEKFAKILDLDPWHFSPYTEALENIDFQNPSDLEKIAETANHLIQKIADKYREHEIEEKPYFFIKDMSGTYGMAIDHFSSAQEILTMNNRRKNNLGRARGGQKVTSILVQEGIPTVERVKDIVAEPVIYSIGGQPFGGFFRMHEKKDARGNLNSPGLKFTKHCFHDLSAYIAKTLYRCEDSCLITMYFTIAEIANIAAAQEHASRKTSQK